MRWAYTSHIASKPDLHYFLADIDHELTELQKQYLHVSDIVIPTKTEGHFHILNFQEEISFERYLERLRICNADPNFRLGVLCRGYGRLWVHGKLDIHQRLVENDAII